MPPFAMGFGGEGLMPMVRASVAPSTWTGYGKAWEEWLAVVGERRVDSIDSVRLEVTTDYIMELRRQSVTAALVQQRLAGLAFHFKLRGWPDVTKSFIIRQVLKGWRKESVRKDCRRPVSHTILGQIMEATISLCSSSYQASLFRASFCLAFSGALRISKLVSPSRSRPGGLLADDVVSANQVLRIRIRRSKTDVLGRGEWIPLRSIQAPYAPSLQLVNLWPSGFRVSSYCYMRMVLP